MQIDGSEHRWFEDRGGMCTLLAFVDDATSRLMQLRFVASESRSATASTGPSRMPGAIHPHEGSGDGVVLLWALHWVSIEINELTLSQCTGILR